MLSAILQTIKAICDRQQLCILVSQHTQVNERLAGAYNTDIPDKHMYAICALTPMLMSFGIMNYCLNTGQTKTFILKFWS